MFLNGGYSANDEACVSFEQILINLMAGQQFIKTTFGEEELPYVGWQIDSFGHSKTNQRLFQEIGLEAMFAARQDFREFEWRTKNKQLEFQWQINEKESIFTHIFQSHYSSPDFVDL